jgi:hypothetical protein
LGFTLGADRESHYGRMPLRVVLRVNGAAATEFPVEATADLHFVRLRLPPGQRAFVMNISCSGSFVPARLGINADWRELSLKLTRMKVDDDLLLETSECRLDHVRGFYHAGEAVKWAAPRVDLEATSTHGSPLILRATITCHTGDVYDRFPFRVVALADDREMASTNFTSSNQRSTLDIPIRSGHATTHIQLLADAHFVPGTFYNNEDQRELSYVIEHLELRASLPAPRVEPLPANVATSGVL